MISPARLAAYDVLREVTSGRADLPHALARARTALPDERDRALAGEIAAGALRWQAACDRIVAELSGRAPDRLDAEVLDILRLTIFQLLHLTRVPASAAVNDAVSLTRRAGKKSAAPFVNAILRRVSRQRDALPLPPRPVPPFHRAAALDYLGTTLSHPRWLMARWLDRYGFDAAEAWALFDNTPPRLTLRANRLKTTPETLAGVLADHGVTVVPGRYAPDALLVTAGNPLLTPLADSGVFVVQDEASQLVALMVEAHPGARLLDACAAPGGKTTALAAVMEDRGLVVAADIRARRVDLLARTVRASAAGCIRVVQADAAAPLPFRAEFDRVLLDAPCSGLGTLRRDPDLRWRRREADLAPLAAAQTQMLREALRVLRPGGQLVYATCSSEPEENENVVRTVIGEGLAAPRRPHQLPAAVEALLDADGRLRTYPFRDGLDAFFAAILVTNL